MPCSDIVQGSTEQQSQSCSSSETKPRAYTGEAKHVDPCKDSSAAGFQPTSSDLPASLQSGACVDFSSQRLSWPECRFGTSGPTLCIRRLAHCTRASGCLSIKCRMQVVIKRCQGRPDALGCAFVLIKTVISPVYVCNCCFHVL